jgi:uncharacterized protein (TIGR00661 family)
MREKPLHIVVSPLDWGLGHAARCIPVIQQLITAGHKVTLAGYGRSLILLMKEFPKLESIELPGFSPSYSRSGNMVLHLFLLLPHFLVAIIKEHRILKKLISRYNFDVIISDNRYGLWNKKVRSILITHQVMIKAPLWLKFAEYPLYRISLLFISRFDECWIPDFSQAPGLSGDLSHKYPVPKNARYINPLSRFQLKGSSAQQNPTKRNILVIISGPEPQRSIFEDLVIKQHAGLNFHFTLLKGLPENETGLKTENNLTILPHSSTDNIKSLIKSSDLVICRSGYSSVMDLQALGARALFVPTPGQTEQEYIAVLLQNRGIAWWRAQGILDLKKDIPEALKYKGFEIMNKGNVLCETLAGLKKK